METSVVDSMLDNLPTAIGMSICTIIFSAIKRTFKGDKSDETPDTQDEKAADNES